MKTVSVKIVSQLLDLSTRRVQQLVTEGVIPKPESGKYDLVKAIHGYINYLRRQIREGEEVSITDQRKRLVKAQAEKQELDNQRKKGELLPADLIHVVLVDVLSRVRTNLLGISGRIAPQVSGLTDRRQARSLIENVVRDALEETAEIDYGKFIRDSVKTGQSGGRRTKAAANVDGERVGRQKKKTKSRSKRRTGAMDNGEG